MTEDLAPEDLTSEDNVDQPKSKTRIKAEMEALQELGRALTLLKPAQLSEVPISEELTRAIKESHRITKNEAKRRHLNYIGRLMRSEDAEAIQHALDRFNSSSQRFAQELHLIESWRDRLIAEGNDALTEFIEAHPGIDSQQLTQLVRNTKKDVSLGRNTGNARKLFQFIRSV